MENVGQMRSGRQGGFLGVLNAEDVVWSFSIEGPSGALPVMNCLAWQPSGCSSAGLSMPMSSQRTSRHCSLPVAELDV